VNKRLLLNTRSRVSTILSWNRRKMLILLTLSLYTIFINVTAILLPSADMIVYSTASMW